MRAFKHFDVTRYLEEAKLESQVRDPAKTAKAAKDAPQENPSVATLAALAGVQAESSNLEGAPGEEFCGPASVASSDPFKTETQPADAVGSPAKAWAAAAAQLQHMDRPAQVSPKRWQQVIADADRLLMWVPMLEAMDWTVEDVFGRDAADTQSVAWRVEGQRIGPVTSIAIVLRAGDGAVTHIYRRNGKDTGDET